MMVMKDKLVKFNHKGMYYRVDMKLVDRGIYIFETQVKYPWYSLFNG